MIRNIKIFVLNEQHPLGFFFDTKMWILKKTLANMVDKRLSGVVLQIHTPFVLIFF